MADLPSPPRFALTTLYDEGFASVGWYCRNTLARYGQRHGHDVVFARAADSDRPPSWHKLLLVRALFDRGYDYVFWVDADAMIIDGSADVAALARPDKDFHLVEHPFNGERPNTPNMGVFLIRNSAWSRDLIDRLWSLDKFAHATWWENAALLELLGLPGFEAQGIDPSAGCQLDTDRIDYLPCDWNRVGKPGPPGPSIVRHFAGKSQRNRLRNMPFWLNWPKALRHELTRNPQPLDLSAAGVQGGTIEFAAPRPNDQAARPSRAAA